MNQRFLVVFFSIFFFSLLCIPAICFSDEPKETGSTPLEKIPPEKLNEEEFSRELLQAFRGQKRTKIDTRMAIVKKLIEVNKMKLYPEDFYKQVSELPMPEGKELRHVLMEVKKDVGNRLGDKGLNRVFGEKSETGGSIVEEKILSYRKKLVMDTIQDVIVKFAKTKPQFTVYYGEVGGWPNETGKDMKFAGDIDFNFLSGDLQSALDMKKLFDEAIFKKFGRTPEEIDIPCTVHGMGTDEVYVGRHGQTFAELVTKLVKRISFGEDGKKVGIIQDEPVKFKSALKTMLLEGKASKLPLADLDTSKFPSEPGLTMEMIRHFEHDIVYKNVYTDLESFVKAAKYADRSFTAMEDDGAKVAEADMVLRQFTADLVALKKDPGKLVKLIEKYYKDIGKPLPFDVKLDITPDGKTTAQIEINEAFIKGFWDVCRKTMWKSAKLKLRKLVTEYKQKVRSLHPDDMEAAKDIYEKLMQYNEIIEVEDRVIRNKKAGIHDIDPEYTKLVEEFRSTVKEYKQKIAKNGQLKFIDPTKQAAYEFVKAQLDLKSDFNMRLAGATLVNAVSSGTVNDILDYLDDRLLTTLRNGPVQDYETFLNKGVEQSWDAKVQAYIKGFPKDSWRKAFLTWQDPYRIGINKWFNDRLVKSCKVRGVKLLTTPAGKVAGGALKGVQKINSNFSASVAASPAGQKAMKGMMLYNLKDEIPLYLEFMKNEDWDGLATEFFRRRVPFGSAVERGVMGDYYGVAWEATATMLPPLAIASAAASVGEATASIAWDFYWSDELELFIDDLYKDAKFEALSVEEIGNDIEVTQWNLLSVKYRDKEYDIDELIGWEKEDAAEMANCLKMKTDERELHFPMAKTTNHLFEWYQVNTALRINLRKTDPWIQLIEEMEKYEHVGEKLKEYYGYQKLARWESLKVKFLEHLKEELAKRRAASDSILKGNVPKLVDELMEIAEKLDVRPQIEADLEKQFGGNFYYTYSWMKDYLRSKYREYRNKTDIWDVYEKWAAAVSEYLGTYNKILAGREQGEKQLEPAYRQDQGLRLLTGPYFLDGNAEVDGQTHERWVSYPAQAKKTMTRKLSEIKAAARANPVALDLSENAFDNKTLYLLTYHDSFKEMWKHVSGRAGILEIPSYLGGDSARQASPNESGVAISDQARALDRFKYHAESIEDLLNEFRTHYGLRKEDALTKLRENRDRAVRLASEICTLASSASTAMKTMAGGYKTAKDPFVIHENKIREAVNTARRIHSIEDELKTYQGKAKVLGEKIKMSATSIDTNRSLVCELAEQMKVCETNDQRDQIYYKASAAHPDIKPAYESSGAAYRDLKELEELASEKLDLLNNAKDAAEGVSGIPQGLQKIRNDMSQGSDESEALIRQAKEKAEILAKLVTDSGPLHDEAKRVLTSERKTVRGRILWNEMLALVNDINASEKNAKACLKESEDKADKGRSGTDKFNVRYNRFSDDIQLLRGQFVTDSQGGLPKKVESAFAKAALVEMYAANAGADMESSAEDMVFAKACMNLIEENSRVNFSAVMPNVIGMGCQEGMNAVSGAGIKNQYKYIAKATHPDWEYRVQSTNPVAGKDVHVKETTATVNCFEDLDVAAFLATVDCSGVPKSTAEYDRNSRTAFCDCKGGLVFNPSRTICVDCNEYYRGYVTELNAGNMQSAQAWVNESLSCSWSQQAQGQIRQASHQQACNTIASNLHAACSNNNAQWAWQHLQEANQWQCGIDPNLVQWAHSIINAYNQSAQQQQQQPQQPQQQQGIPGRSTGGSAGAGQVYGIPQGSGVGVPGAGAATTGAAGNTGGTQGNTTGSQTGGAEGKVPTDGKDPYCPSGVYVMGVCSGG